MPFWSPMDELPRSVQLADARHFTTRPGLIWLFEQMDTGDRSQCWEFPYSRDPQGYGRLMFRARSDRAHRVAWMIERGEVLPADRKQVVLHDCDNPPCCNPAHLRLGTQSENIKQAHDRGLIATARGEDSAHARLTGDQVTLIRQRHAAGESQRALGREFGVSQVAVHHIVHRRTWRHVA